MLRHVATLIGLGALGVAVGWVVYKAFGNGFSASGGGPLFVR